MWIFDRSLAPEPSPLLKAGYCRLISMPVKAEMLRLAFLSFILREAGWGDVTTVIGRCFEQ